MPITTLTLIFQYDEKVPAKLLEEHLTSELEHARKYPGDFSAEYLVGVKIKHGKTVREKIRKTKV